MMTFKCFKCNTVGEIGNGFSWKNKSENRARCKSCQSISRQHQIINQNTSLDTEIHAQPTAGYSNSNKRYTFYLKEGAILHLTNEDIEKAFLLYPEKGSNLTANEVIRILKLTDTAWNQIKSKLKLTKKSNIIAPHKFNELSSDEETIEYIDSKLIEAYDYKKDIITDRFDKKWRKHAQKLDSIHVERDHYAKKYASLIAEAFTSSKPKYTIKNFYIPPTNTVEQVVTFINDFHYGKKAFGLANGTEYNCQIAEQRVNNFINHMVSTYSGTLIRFYSLGDIIETALEDGFHPAHHESMDCSPIEMIKNTTQLFTEMLLNLSDKNTVRFQMVGGNHDRVAHDRKEDKLRTGSQYLHYCIELATNPLKTSNLQLFPHSQYTYICDEVNRVGVFGHHGDDRKSNLKPEHILNYYMQNVSCDYYINAQGHWHHEHSTSPNNVYQIKLPSWCGHDNHADQQGYSVTTSLPSFVKFIKVKGERGLRKEIIPFSA